MANFNDEILEEILRHDPRLCKRLGITKDSKWLGAGAYAEVYESAHGKAIKVSFDAKEAYFCRKLVGKRSKYVVNVYSVHKIRNRDIWLICMEKLDRNSGFKSFRSTMRHPHVKKGLKYLQKYGFEHSDIHEENVMKCKKTNTYKIIDFQSDFSNM